MEKSKCPFCNIKEILFKDKWCYLKWDLYPVTNGHVLIIPFRHVENYFELSQHEIESVSYMIIEGRKLLEKEFKPDGYNIGINIGKDAGQTISHTHIHLIPRYQGDIRNPSGGVRGVIPAKKSY